MSIMDMLRYRGEMSIMDINDVTDGFFLVFGSFLQ